MKNIRLKNLLLNILHSYIVSLTTAILFFNQSIDNNDILIYVLVICIIIIPINSIIISVMGLWINLHKLTNNRLIIIAETLLVLYLLS